MDLLDVHRQARQRTQITLHRFLIDFGRDAYAILAFVEGENDESIYLGFLNQFNRVGWPIRVYRCNGRDGVYWMRGQVAKRMSQKYLALYFVDRDLADFIPEHLPAIDEVFATDFYSIENWVVCPTVLIRSLREIYHVELSLDEERKVLETFDLMVKAFYRLASTLMAWILHQRKAGAKFHANEVRLDDLIHIEIANDYSWKVVASRARTAHLLEASPAGPRPGISDVRLLRRHLTAVAEPKQYVRGKFELWFMAKFLRLMEQVLRANGKRPTARVQINEKNLLDVIGPRCRLPIVLETFLKRHMWAASWPR